MKTIIAIGLSMVLLSTASADNHWVKTDWFVDQIEQPARSVKEIIDTEKMRITSASKYNLHGFKETTVLTIEYQNLPQRKVFMYFEPYQENQRAVLTTFTEVDARDISKYAKSMDAAIEQWSADFSYQVIDDDIVSKTVMDESGKVLYLSHSFVSPEHHNRYATIFRYFETLEELNAANLGEESSAIVDLYYDDKGSWTHRHSIRNDEHASIQRHIEYY